MRSAVLAVAQSPVVLGDVRANVATAASYIRRAREQGAELVVLPECALTGYAFDTAAECREVALPADGPELTSLAQLGTELGISIVVGYLERDPDDPDVVYNAATALISDGTRGHYRKAHLPTMAADRFATRGAQPPVVVPSPLGGIGLSICYDIRFPEWARSLALSGATIIASPVNFAVTNTTVRDLFPPARAHENSVYFLLANRGDQERRVSYLGRSAIISPMGETLTTTERGEGLLTAEVDLDEAGRGMVVFEPGVSEVYFLRDRRPELYGAVTAQEA